MPGLSARSKVSAPLGAVPQEAAAQRLTTTLEPEGVETGGVQWIATGSSASSPPEKLTPVRAGGSGSMRHQVAPGYRALPPYNRTKRCTSVVSRVRHL